MSARIPSITPARFLAHAMAVMALSWAALSFRECQAREPDGDPLMAALPEMSSRVQQQRQDYRRATQALARGDRTSYNQLAEKLADYPLAPYLEYADLSSRLYHAGDGDIIRFLERYPQAPFSLRLRQRWLGHLAERGRWQEFIRVYKPEIHSAELACQYAYALFHTGNREQAMAAGIPLWQEGKSQPRACDPLFALLIDQGHITEAVAWKRYTSALFNHDYSLARYVSRFFTSPAYQQQARLYLDADQNPRTIGNTSLFSTGTPEERQIIFHALTHLARNDGPMALDLWQRYQHSHPFDAEVEGQIMSAVVKSLYQGGHREKADQYLLQAQAMAPPELMEWRLRLLIEDRNWPAILHWSNNLAEPHRSLARWKYWRARALELTASSAEEEIESLYKSLAVERSFYGFLASERLNTPYQMQHEPVTVTARQVADLAGSEAFLRIRELYHHQDMEWAHREWNQALADAPPERLHTAAKIAGLWQWHNQAIMTMILAGYWNDIDIRFPLPHREAFLRQSQVTRVPVNLLLAVARQESAFNAQVTSPAGAKGLMQLMPATARETARRHNISYYQISELYDPDKNISIGSKYYMEMLKRFNNNRILATAAYNAGPGRVNSWRSRTAGILPFDAWIETIPFVETRNYVQNVLAFSIIYAHHLALNATMLSPEEKNTPL